MILQKLSVESSLWHCPMWEASFNVRPAMYCRGLPNEYSCPEAMQRQHHWKVTLPESGAGKCKSKMYICMYMYICICIYAYIYVK